MSDEFYFDKKAANRSVRFFELCLTHVKGEKAGEPFKLAKWQKERIIRPIFGWKRADGSRKYRIVYVEVPRKNGKSTLASGIALCLLHTDDEPGGEIYSAAGDKEQARIVFGIAKQMSENSEELSERSTIYRDSIIEPSTQSVYRVLSSDVHTKHGLNASGVVFDEFHVQPTRDLWDVLRTSMGSRRQPLIVIITTAGYDMLSVCREMHDYAVKVRDGVVIDESFLPVIYETAEDADWKSPKVWKACNPGYGVSIKKDYLAQECKHAQEVPAYENTFKRLHLDIWTSQDATWLADGVWSACGKRPILEKDLVGRFCYSGLDLATETDLAALVHIFPDDNWENFEVLARFWIPEENMKARINKDRVPYDVWQREGWIEATPGNVIDYDYILNTIDEDARQFDLKEIAFDRWGATRIVQDLDAQGLTVLEFGQGYKSLSPPTKELIKLLLSKKIHHGGNPVLKWMAGNVVIETDAAANIKPSKKKSREKIDGIVALLMAMDRALRHEDESSVYDERGLNFII